MYKHVEGFDAFAECYGFHHDSQIKVYNRFQRKLSINIFWFIFVLEAIKLTIAHWINSFFQWRISTTLSILNQYSSSELPPALKTELPWSSQDRVTSLLDHYPYIFHVTPLICNNVVELHPLSHYQTLIS